MEVPRDDDGVMRNRDGTTRGPGEGIVLTREFGSTEEKRRPGRATIVHEGTNEFCYLPGLPYEDYRPVNAGMFVPAGSDMIVSLHYTSTGLAVVDRSRIGFTVTKAPPAKKFLPQDGPEGENPPVGRRQANADAGDSASCQQPSGASGANQLPQGRRARLVPASRACARKERPIQADISRWAGRNRAQRSEVRLQLAAHVQNVAEDPKGSTMHVQFFYDNSRGEQVQP